MERPENRSYGKERIGVKKKCWSNWGSFLFHTFRPILSTNLSLTRRLKGNRDDGPYYDQIREEIKYDGTW